MTVVALRASVRPAAKSGRKKDSEARLLDMGCLEYYDPWCLLLFSFCAADSQANKPDKKNSGTGVNLYAALEKATHLLCKTVED